MCAVAPIVQGHNADVCRHAARLPGSADAAVVRARAAPARINRLKRKQPWICAAFASGMGETGGSLADESICFIGRSDGHLHRDKSCGVHAQNSVGTHASLAGSCGSRAPDLTCHGRRAVAADEQRLTEDDQRGLILTRALVDANEVRCTHCAHLWMRAESLLAGIALPVHVDSAAK